MAKELGTLVEDIYNLFDPDVDHEASEENLARFAEVTTDILRDRLRKRKEGDALRFSSLGKPDRQVWYKARGYPEEPMQPKNYIKFLYGDLIEAMLLFLAKEAGHDVQEEQGKVSVNGVNGSYDAIIDGIMVDAKSASPYGFQKLKQLKVLEEDPFGYVAQLAGYTSQRTPGGPAAWFAADKVSGELAVPILSTSIIAANPPEERIAHLKEVIESDEPPARCYPDEPDGKSGNRKLGTGCSYCPFRNECWPGVRAFAYSTGPRYLTRVVELPRVPELTTGTSEVEVND